MTILSFFLLSNTLDVIKDAGTQFRIVPALLTIIRPCHPLCRLVILQVKTRHKARGKTLKNIMEICIFVGKKKELKRMSSCEVERFYCSFGADKDLCGLSAGLKAEPLLSPRLHLSGLKLFYLSTFFFCYCKLKFPLHRSRRLYPPCPTR